MERLIYQPNDALISSVQSDFEDDEKLFQMLELFPFPIQLFAPDGTSVFVSQALRETYNIPGSAQMVGKYNLKQDPIIHRLGLGEYLRRSFEGEIVLVPDVRVPLESMSLQYGPRRPDYNIESMYTDILTFPIWGPGKDLRYIVSMLIPTRVYQGQSDVVRAREFMDNHWVEEFDMDSVAQSVHLSRYHFARLFKRHTGMTPYGYYQCNKVSGLKNALCDRSLSVAEAFAACGVEYSGNFAKLFKDKVGLSPSQYRKSILS